MVTITTERAALLLALVLAACGDDHRVRGRIDGERIPLKTSAYVEIPGVYENGDGQIVMVATNLPDTCTPFSDFWALVDENRPPDVLAERWAELFPPDFWWVQTELRLTDPSVRLQAPAEMVGAAGDAYPQASGEAWASFVHVTDWLDEAYWAGDVADAPTYGARSDGGTLWVNHHLPEQTFVASFETGTTIAGDEDLGDVILDTFSFSCPGLVPSN